MGCPVVASDHGGAREQVVGNRTAFLFPPSDAAQLTEMIRKALALNADERERLAEEARAHVIANFDKRHMCAATLALYREILRTEAMANLGAERHPQTHREPPTGP